MVTAPPPSTPPSIGFHPLSLVRMLWKQKLLILMVWVVVALAGLAYVRLIPNVYRAESLILVDSQKIPERFVSATVQVSLQDHLATIRQQILSTTQLEKTVKKFDLYAEERKSKSPEQIIERAQQEIGIALDRGWSGGRPGAFRISYEGRNPVVVAGVVNELSGLFIAENLKTRALRAEDTSEFIESQLREARKQLEEQEASYTRFKLQRTGELPEQQASLNATLSRLQTELQGHQDAINRAEQNKVMLENTLRMAESSEAMLLRSIQQITTPTPTTATSTPRFDPMAATPAPAPPPRRSEVLKGQLETLKLRYQDLHPEIKRLNAEIAAALRQEAGEVARPSATPASGTTGNAPAVVAETRPAPVVPPQLVTELHRERERVAETKTQLAIATRQLGAHSADRQRVLRSIGEYQGRLDRVPMREQEMAAVTRDYENSKQNYRSLMEKKMSAELAAEMERRQQSERFTLQDPARVPSEPIKPKRKVLNLVAAIAGLVIGLALALGIEFRKNRLLGEWELPAGVTVLGRVPTIVIAKTPQPGGLQHQSGVVSHV